MSATADITVEIGQLPIAIRSSDAAFRQILTERYAGFLAPSADSRVQLEVELVPPGMKDPDEDVEVTAGADGWHLSRGDFEAEFDPARGCGKVRHSANPYSIDSVLRIVHSIVLAEEGGFLVHSASAFRNGKAFLFSGVSGAGKTTISRLAPPDATLLSDEISYVRKTDSGYVAFGTPFFGELGHGGDNVSAPIAALYLLAKGPENKIEPIAPADATRLLLRNILFFARERDLVEKVFAAAFDFVARVPVYRLTFFPDQRVWELVR